MAKDQVVVSTNFYSQEGRANSADDPQRDCFPFHQNSRGAEKGKKIFFLRFNGQI